MNIDRMIHTLLFKLSIKHKIFVLEKKNYRNCHVFKSYLLKIDDNDSVEFQSKKDFLIYLSKLK